MANWKAHDGYESIEVYEHYFQMNNVEQELRFVKFHQMKSNNKRTQRMIITTCMDAELQTLYKIIKARQDIENSIFHKLKTDSGLSHCLYMGECNRSSIMFNFFSFKLFGIVLL